MTEAPTVFDRVSSALSRGYRLERELGRGGMATVYLAEDLKHHRPVAVKVLHPELAAALGHERFLREVEIAARLQHPHVLTLIDSGEADGFLYYVMPFVDGGSLRARLAQEHELPIADVVRIIREVADALAEAHVRGVVHRDIKPDNILLRGQHVVVTDFGIAKAVSEATGLHAVTSVGVTLGTPTYMAPEQAAGDPAIDHRADIYALGVMAYEMLTGAPPFTGAAAQSVLAAHMTRQPEPIDSRRAAVPAALSAVVMRCLEKKPADRWQSVTELLAQLDAMSTPGGGMLPLSPTATRRSESHRSPTRNRVMVLIAVLAVVGVAGYALRSRITTRAAGGRRLPVVVVLPFENLGAPNDEYFADGMTEEITGRLQKLAGLAVIARTSAIQYKKTTKSITQIAKELGADFLVEGTARWEKTPNGEGTVRVRPRVIRASDGTAVWSDTFDKAYGTEIFAIQSDIAEQVVRAMDVTLNPADRRVVRAVPTTNLAAYKAYIQAQDYLDSDFAQNWEAERKALESLEQAVRLDPLYADAHARLAWLHVWLASNGYDDGLNTGIPSKQRWEMVRAAAGRALAVDSQSATAHGALAKYYGTFVRDTARERDELARAQLAEPNSPDVIAARGYGLAAVGLTKDALHELERAAALDPRNPLRFTAIALFHNQARDFPAEQAAIDHASALAPMEATLYAWRAWLYLMRDRRDSARAVLKEGIAQSGVNLLLFRTAQNSVWVTLIRILHDQLGDPAARITLKEFGVDSADYYEAKVRAYVIGSPQSRAYFDSLAAWSAPRARLATRSSFYKLELAYSLAGAGRRTEAEDALLALPPIDSVAGSGFGSFRLVRRAEAFVMIGDYESAVGCLRLALADSVDLFYTPAVLRLDPIWNPLSGRADFKKLVEQQ